jgi:phosphoribosylformylglycinamidine synthase
MCAARGIPFARIGVDDDGPGDQEGEPVLDVQGLFTVPLAELREAHELTLPAALGG